MNALPRNSKIEFGVFIRAAQTGWQECRGNNLHQWGGIISSPPATMRCPTANVAPARDPGHHLPQYP
jgi:hypothetical protein